MKVLIIDNYDSFTYNIYQTVGVITGNEPLVYLNDQITIKQVKEINPDRIIISSGIGSPLKEENCGNCVAIVKEFYNKIPILGISIGNLIIANTFKCKIVFSPNVQHGELISVNLNKVALFDSLPDKMTAMAYYTYIIDNNNLPNNIDIIAETDTKTIMGFKVKNYPVYGLQFNPESIGTHNGSLIFKNFLN